MAGYAFHFMNTKGQAESSAYGGILPDPVELGNSTIYVDGRIEETSSTSGTLQYLIVQPGDYPTDAEGRFKRGGKVESK